jgi:prepilin-type N-terminal cleavage/methylation domain-containing protein
MLHSNASKDLGFTLTESLIVVAIVGILAAMGMPSLIAAQNRAKLSQATDLVVASLQQVQQEAIRRNQSCTLTLDKIERKIAGSQGCLVTGDRILPEEIALDYTGAGNIQYGIRGNTTANKSIVLAIVGNPNLNRCMTVSAPLGIIRLGTYDAIASTCRKLII